MYRWQELVTEWVNCFPFADPKYSSFSDLDSNFVIEELLMLANTECETVNPSHKPFENISDFLSRKYPEYSLPTGKICNKELLYILSLFIHFFFFVESIRKKMCQQPHTFQETVQKFLSPLVSASSINRDLVKMAIDGICKEQTEEFTTPGTPQFKSSPYSNTNSPLLDFYQSPLVLKFRTPSSKHNRSVRDNNSDKVRWLEEDLEENAVEREKLQVQLKETNNLNTKLAQRLKNAEERILQQDEEIELLTETSKRACGHNCKDKIQQLQKRNKELDQCMSNLLKDIEEQERENSRLTSKLDTLKVKFHKDKQAIIDECDQKLLGLERIVNQKNLEIENLHSESRELRQIIKTFNQPNSPSTYDNLNNSSTRSYSYNSSSGVEENLNEALTEVLLKEKEEELKEMKKNILEVEEKLKLLQEDNCVKDSQLELLNNENQSLQTSNLELQDKIDVLEELSNGLSNNFSRLKEEREQLFREKQQISKQLEEAITSIKDVSASNSELVRKCQQTEIDKNKVIEELSNFQTQIQNLMKEKSYLLGKIEKLNCDQSRLGNQIDMLENELRVKEEEAGTFLIQLKEAEAKTQTLQELKMSVEEDVHVLQDNLTSIKAINSTLESDLKSQREEYEILMTKHSQLKDELSDTIKQKEQMFAEFSTMMHNFTSQNQCLTAEKENVLKNIEQLQQTLENERNCKNGILEKYNDCTSILVCKEEIIETLTSQLEMQSKNMMALEECERILQQELQDKKTTVDSLLQENCMLKKDLEDTKRAINELHLQMQDEKHKAESQIKTLQDELDAKNDNIDFLMKKNEDDLLVHKTVTKKLNDIVQEKEEEISKNAMKIQQNEDSIAHLEISLSKSKAELEYSKQEVDKLSTEISNLEAKIIETENCFKNELHSLELQKQNELDNLEMQNNKLSSEIEELMIQLDCEKDIFSTTCEKQSSEIERLTICVQNLEKTCSSFKYRISELENMCITKDSQIEEKTNTNVCLERAVKSLEETIRQKVLEYENSVTTLKNDLTQEIKNMAETVEEVSKEKLILENCLQKERNEKLKYIEKYDDCCSVLLNREQTIEALTAEIKGYSNRVCTLESDVQILETELDEARSSNDYFCKKQNELEAIVRSITKEKEDLILELSKIKSSNAADIQKLSDEIVKNECSIDQLQKQLHDVNTKFDVDIKKKDDEIAENLSQIHHYETTVLSYKNQISECISDVERLNHNISKLKEENVDLVNQMVISEQNHNAMVVSFRNEIQELLAQKTSLTEELDKAYLDLNDKVKIFSEREIYLTSEISNLQERLDKYKNEYSLMRQEIHDFEIKYKVARSETEERDCDIILLSESMLEIKSHVSGLIDEKNRFLEDTGKLREELETVSEELKEAQNKYLKCYSDLMFKEQELDSLNGLTKTFVESISKVEQEKEALLEMLNNEKIKNQQLLTENSKTQYTLNIQLYDKDQTIDKLDSELKMCVRKMDGIIKEKTELENLLQEEKHKTEFLSRQLNESKEELDKNHKVLEDINTKLMLHSHDMENLEKDKSELEKQLKYEKHEHECLLAKQGDCEEKLREKEEKIQDLTSVMSTYLKDMKDLEDEKRELERELETSICKYERVLKEEHILKETISQNERTIRELSEKLHTAENNYHDSANAEEELQRKLKEEKEKNGCISIQLYELIEMMHMDDCHKMCIVEDLTAEVNTYSKRVNELENIKLQVEKKLYDGLKNVECLTKQNELLKEEFNAKIKASEDLQSEIAKEKYSLEQQLNETQFRVTNQSNSLEKLQEELKDCNLKFKCKEQMYEEMLTEVRSELSEKLLDVERYKSFISNVQKELNNLVSEFETSEMISLSNSCVDQGITRVYNKYEMSSVTSNNEETTVNLNEDIEKVKDIIERGRNTLKSLQLFYIGKYQNNLLEIENLKCMIRNYEKENSDQKAKISTLEAINSNSASDLAEKVSKINDLISSLHALENTLIEKEHLYETDVSTLKTNYDFDLKRLKEENNNLVIQIDKWSADLNQKERDNSQLTNQVQSLEKQLQSERSTLESLLKENEHLKQIRGEAERCKENLLLKMEVFIKAEKSLNDRLKNITGYGNLQYEMKKFLQDYLSVNEKCRSVLSNKNLKSFDMQIITNLHNDINKLGSSLKLEHTQLFCNYMDLLRENITWCENNILKFFCSVGMESYDVDSCIQEHEDHILSNINKLEHLVLKLIKKFVDARSKCKTLVNHCIPIIMNSISSNDASEHFVPIESTEENILSVEMSDSLVELEHLRNENISLKFKVNELEETLSSFKQKVLQLDNVVEEKNKLKHKNVLEEASVQKLKLEYKEKVKELETNYSQEISEKDKEIYKLKTRLEQVISEKDKQIMEKQKELDTLEQQLHSQYSDKLDRYKKAVVEKVCKDAKAIETKAKENARKKDEIEKEMEKVQKRLHRVLQEREAYYHECIRLKDELKSTSRLNREPLSQVKNCRSEEVLNIRDRGLDANNETFVSRRSSIFGGGKENSKHLFWSAMEDESEEFNSKYLDDLKAGRCEVKVEGKERLTELRIRNSMCLPHLKSSYPAETQFHNPIDFTEDDLKLGSAVDIDQTTSLLQSDRSHRRKEKPQTSYSKPGPPTPGKNCSRLSLQGTEATPRRVLGEKNEQPRKAITPGTYIRNLFTRAGRHDENTQDSPAKPHRRTIFKKARI